MSKKSGHDRWVPGENGYEKTDSPHLIKQAISNLNKRHRFVNLLHKNYQSGDTHLVSAAKDSLTFDRPLDWPGLYKDINVIYRDGARVWNYFAANIIAESKDTLKTTFPTQLFRLQRREHFRVVMPLDCTVSFRKKDANFSNIMVNDLSVGGMSICVPDEGNGAGLKEDQPLADLIINLPGSGEDADSARSLAIPHGLIVRSFKLSNGQKCLGIKFHLQAKEEHELMHFVRQSELAALRKGIL